jgi:hypothetical protein
MDYRRDGWIWTAGLIGSGVLVLAWNLGLFVAYEPWPQYLFIVLLALAGISFFVGYVRATEQWWRLIPGWTMLALALMLFLSTLPTPPVRLIAALLFWGMALAFGQIYWRQRSHHWWAIIPGGFMLVLGVTIVLSGFITDIELLGALLFVGMGGVFYLLYALSARPRQWWALIPASVLFLFGIIIAVAQRTGEGVGSEEGVIRWWPLFLIVAGLFAGWVTYRTPSSPKGIAKRSRTGKDAPSADGPTGSLGEYTQPAPGASVELMNDIDERT